MNYALIQSYIKEIIERETGETQPVGDTEIQQAINDVHREFVARTHLLHGSAHVITETDVDRYDYPPRMLTTTRVTLSRKKLLRATFDDLDNLTTDGTWYPNKFTVGSATLTTGSGLDDITAGGVFTGTFPISYTVKVDATGTPDTFAWSKDGTEQATGVSMSTSAITLDLGVTVLWASNTSHTLNDVWTFLASGVPATGTKSWVNDF